MLLIPAAWLVYAGLEFRAGRHMSLSLPLMGGALLTFFFALIFLAAGRLIDLAARANFNATYTLERLQKVEQAADLARREASTATLAMVELLQEMKAWRAVSEKNEGKALVFLHNLDSRAEHANNLLEWLGKSRRPSTGSTPSDAVEENA
jgi:hypothetical protein